MRKREPEYKTCVECGAEFERPSGGANLSDAQWENRKTCGMACGGRLAGRAKRKPKQLTLPRTIAEHTSDGKRRCPKCNLRKPLEDFPKKGAQRNGDDRYGYCKPCHGVYQRQHRLLRVFSLTVDEYEAIVAYQDGLCAICKRPPLNNRLAVDHAHASGLVRGALCWSCNKTLGFLREDIARMEAAISYLTDPPAPRALGRDVFARKGRITNKRGRKTKRKAIRYLEQQPIQLPEETT
jgi:hypothetical protein